MKKRELPKMSATELLKDLQWSFRGILYDELCGRVDLYSANPTNMTPEYTLGLKKAVETFLTSNAAEIEEEMKGCIKDYPEYRDAEQRVERLLNRFLVPAIEYVRKTYDANLRDNTYPLYGVTSS